MPPSRVDTVDAVAGDASVSDSSVEDAIACGGVAEDAIADDAIAEDAVAEDAIAEDAVAEDAVAEDAVAEDVIAEDVIACGAVAGDPAVSDGSSIDDVVVEGVLAAMVSEVETVALVETEALLCIPEAASMSAALSWAGAGGRVEGILPSFDGAGFLATNNGPVNERDIGNGVFWSFAVRAENPRAVRAGRLDSFGTTVF
jgi:pentapeptide MXKDX repeat protein